MKGQDDPGEEVGTGYESPETDGGAKGNGQDDSGPDANTHYGEYQSPDVTPGDTNVAGTGTEADYSEADIEADYPGDDNKPDKVHSGSTDSNKGDKGDSSSDSSSSDSLETAKTLASAAQAGAVNSATGAARASGLSPSQAALVGANAGSSTYQNTLSNTATTYSAQDLEKLLTEEGYTVQTNENTANAAGTGLSGLATLLLSVLGLKSDRGVKENIHDGWGILDHVVGKLNPKTFAYKSDPKVTRVGIIAQDLEKTPLAYTVKDTPAGKVIDVPQLTGANTAMISDLSHKLDKAMSMWKGGKK